MATATITRRRGRPARVIEDGGQVRVTVGGFPFTFRRGPKNALIPVGDTAAQKGSADFDYARALVAGTI